MDFIYCALISLCFLTVYLTSPAASQTSNDPILRITHTVPDSSGIGNRVVYGQKAKDVVLNCFAENLRPHHQVSWERYVPDMNYPGMRRQVHISTDMDTQDNMKWSIEKPTDSSWRLRIRSLRWDDNSNYTCYVPLDTYGNRIQDYKTVVVIDPPTILQGETTYNQRVEEGNSVTLTCKASGVPRPTVMWRRQGNMNLPTSAGGGVVKLSETLVISEVKPTDQGLYICDVMNSFGSDRRDMYLHVDYAPKIRPEAATVGQAVGYQRTMACHVHAYPQPNTDISNDDGVQPELYWRKQGATSDILDDERNTIRIIEGAYGLLTFELRITPVESADFGTYTCYAQNSRGSGTAEVELVELADPVPDKGKISGAMTHMHTSPAALYLMLTIVFLIFSVFL